MALVAAVYATLAVAMASSFFSLDSVRVAVASAIAASNSLMAAATASRSCARYAIVQVNSYFVVSFVSCQPLRSVSTMDSSIGF